MTRARQVANFDPALFAADEVSGDKVSGGTISTFASTGIDDDANALAITIDSSERVGIGDTTPQGLVEINNRNVGTGCALFIKGGEDDLDPISGQYTGLAFGYGGGDIYNNTAIIHEFTSAAAAAKLHLCLNTATGDGTPLISDAKLTLSGSNVGIGTSSPAYDLHASNSSANCFFGVESSGSNQTIIKLISGATRLNTDTTRLIFDCGSTNCAIIQVDQGGTQNTAGLSFWTANGAASSQKLKINADGTFVGSGSANISDERLKENITPITNGLASINALSGKTFTWKTKADMQTGIQYGLIAQEVESVLPDLILDNCSLRKIDTATDEIADDDAQTGVNGIEYAKNVKVTAVIPILVEAVKELSAKVTALENA